MTRDKAIKQLEINKKDDTYVIDNEALDMAIKALQEEPCEDAVSRKAVLDIATVIETDDFSGNEIMEVVETDDIKVLPSVTPTRIETVTEFADRCRECGKQKKGKWVLHTYMPHKIYCSECEKDSPYNKRWFFCPNCGAEMGSEE